MIANNQGNSLRPRLRDTPVKGAPDAAKLNFFSPQKFRVLCSCLFEAKPYLTATARACLMSVMPLNAFWMAS